jgi:hypothetical protein
VYAWTGGAAFQSARDRTLGGRPASAGAAAEDAAADEAEPGLIVEGENVPSQVGFGEKIGDVAGKSPGVAVVGGSP